MAYCWGLVGSRVGVLLEGQGSLRCAQAGGIMSEDPFLVESLSVL